MSRAAAIALRASGATHLLRRAYATKSLLNKSAMLSSSYLPITPREHFFSDPFFRTTWGDFDRLHRTMNDETRQFWAREEREAAQMLQHEQDDKKIAKIHKAEVEEAKHHKQELATRSEDFGPSFAPWFFPRRWLLPKLFGGETKLMHDAMKSLDLFQHNGDDHVIRLTNDGEKFELSLDTHGYKPEELFVKVEGGRLTVEGKHEAKREHGYVVRQFSRSFAIPKECLKDRVVSNLSSDGVLIITAPKRDAIEHKNGGQAAIPLAKK